MFRSTRKNTTGRDGGPYARLAASAVRTRPTAREKRDCKRLLPLRCSTLSANQRRARRLSPHGSAVRTYAEPGTALSVHELLFCWRSECGLDPRPLLSTPLAEPDGAVSAGPRGGGDETRSRANEPRSKDATPLARSRSSARVYIIAYRINDFRRPDLFPCALERSGSICPSRQRWPRMPPYVKDQRRRPRRPFPGKPSSARVKARPSSTLKFCAWKS